MDIINFISGQITEDPNVFTESGFSRVRRILFGDVPSINTIGILTAQNPQGRPPVPDDPLKSRIKNKELNLKLFDELKDGMYGPIKIEGQFGNKEESFMVPNITRQELIRLGRRYNQESVIFGSKHHDKDGEPFFRFEYLENGVTIKERTLHWGGKDVQDRPDYFTKVKGRKFLIPFFDEVGEEESKLLRDLRLAESFVIPFFDNPTAQLTYEGPEITYYSDKLPRTKATKNLIESISARVTAALDESKVPGELYRQRGMLRTYLKRLENLA